MFDLFIWIVLTFIFFVPVGMLVDVGSDDIRHPGGTPHEYKRSYGRELRIYNSRLFDGVYEMAVAGGVSFLLVYIHSAVGGVGALIVLAFGWGYRHKKLVEWEKLDREDDIAHIERISLPLGYNPFEDEIKTATVRTRAGYPDAISSLISKMDTENKSDLRLAEIEKDVAEVIEHWKPEEQEAWVTFDKPLYETVDKEKLLTDVFMHIPPYYPRVKPISAFRSVDDAYYEWVTDGRQMVKNLGVENLLQQPVGIGVPDELRFEHTWCLAPPGTGKTQLIQHLVNEDLNREGSIVVIDSQGDLINNLKRIKGIENRLVVLQPDYDHPPCLNLFDIGIDNVPTKDREKYTNAAIDQLTYVVEGMMGEDSITAKQTTVFRFLVRLLMVIPNATLATFSDLLNQRELSRYSKYIAKLPKPAQDFLNVQYKNKEFAATKEQVAWRISLLRENTLFDQMFANPKSKLNLFNELNNNKIILVNTDQEQLGGGCSVFGRYIIGLLLTVSQQRASGKRNPVYVYIDEAQDYIATDEKITQLLDKARKMRIALFIAHQRTAQMKSPNVLSALATCAIKFASTDNASDAALLAKSMGTEASVISKQPKQHFAVTARRVVEGASFKVPFLVVEKGEKSTDEEWDAAQQRIWDEYCSSGGAEMYEFPEQEEYLKAAEEHPEYDNPDDKPSDEL